MLSFLCALSTAEGCPTTVSSTEFINIGSSQSGGSISVISSTCNLSISYSLFQNSTASGYGGAIYFSGYTFMCRFVCYSNCVSLTAFTFYIDSNQSSANFTCITRSNSINSSGSYNILQDGEYSSVHYANISNCYSANYVSIIHLSGSASTSSSFCIYSQNSDGTGSSLDLQGNANIYTVCCWNVVNNTPGSKQAFLWINNNAYSFVFTSCCFYENGNKTFLAGDSNCLALPTFIGCYFDILSSSVSGVTTSNCQFGLTAKPTNTVLLLSFERCSDIYNQDTTSAFTTHLSTKLVRRSLFSLILFCVA